MGRPRLLFLLFTLLPVLRCSPSISLGPDEALTSVEGTTGSTNAPAAAQNCSKWNSVDCRGEDDEPMSFQKQPKDEGAENSSHVISSSETTLVFSMDKNQALTSNSSNLSLAAIDDCLMLHAEQICKFSFFGDIMYEHENIKSEEGLARDMQFTFYLTIYLLAVLIGASLIAFFLDMQSKRQQS